VIGTSQGLERLSLSRVHSPIYILPRWVGGWTFLFSDPSLSEEYADQLLSRCRGDGLAAPIILSLDFFFFAIRISGVLVH
jgi:hypothetical protein